MIQLDEIDLEKLVEIRESFYGAAFYKAIVSDLTSTFTACSSINTKLIANGKQGNMGKIGEGLQGISDFTPVGGKLLKILGCCCVFIDRHKQMQAVANFSKIANGPVEMQDIAEATAGWLLMLNFDIQLPKSCFKKIMNRSDSLDEIKILSPFASAPNSYLFKITDSGALKETTYKTFLSVINNAATSLGEQHGHILAGSIINYLFRVPPEDYRTLDDKVTELVLAVQITYPAITYEAKVHKTAEQILGIIKYKAPGHWKENPQIEKIFLEKLEMAIKEGMKEYDFASLIKTEQSKKCVGTSTLSFLDYDAVQKDDLFPKILGAVAEEDGHTFI
jgi:hypothetical protein